MAVNQSQVDHIITAASEDDPEVKLQNLEREVDLIKTSIKRLLMDIRERMNEMENPFTIVTSPGGVAGAGGSDMSASNEAEEAKKSALEAREAALDARESEMEATEVQREAEKRKDEADKKKKEAAKAESGIGDDKKALDEQMMALLHSQIGAPSHKPSGPVSSQTAANEKLRLQKVYKLFKWTHTAVKKFGHDRLEIMLESYRVMGYISRESADEIREISRLMPANLGEEHEVGPDEFVSELYALNRILTPNDTSLDRDMIEVMMEQRHTVPAIPGRKAEDRIDLSSIPVSDKKSSSKDREKDEEWMNLPDRI